MRTSNHTPSLDQHIGSRLRILRMERGLSLESVAEILEVSQQQVSRYEYGRNRLSAAQIYWLARCLDVPVAWFFRNYPEEEAELRRLQVRFPERTSWRPESDADREQALLRAWRALRSDRQKESVLGLLESFVFDKGHEGHG